GRMTVPLLLVRHAYAGNRKKWEGPDDRRPLTGTGRREAAGLVDVLASFRVERIMSSWYVRCLETVVPLACDRRLPIDVDAALAEASAPADVLALVRRSAGTVTVLCTHGDVIENLFSCLGTEDGLDLGDDSPMAKGSTWVLEADGDGGRIVSARYLAAP
ncbi:MAG: 8-oxo-(d)GTP phosphatase, partial [Actinomycetota bacterium]|nr:8-oxo-(d)GTP phosphatase [Actinomycetota bacterium]